MEGQVSGLKKFSSTRAGKWSIGAAILFIFALIGSLSGKNNNSSSTQSSSPQNINVTQTNGASQQPVETPKQILEQRLTAAIKRTGSTDVSYGGLKIEKSDVDRPADTQMITVNVDISSFYNKNGLLKDTGKLSSSIFSLVYAIPNIKAYDVFVNYNGEITDKYGNKKNDTILVYAIDQATYKKVNWQNFDQSTLCDFLNNESKGTGTFNTACNVLTNIQ
ncbi:MAG: hypothetical protein AAB515_01555 [Patescibacteria group bacterium]